MKELFSFQTWEFISSLWRKDGDCEEAQAPDGNRQELLEEQLLVRRAVNMSKRASFDEGKAWKKVKGRINGGRYLLGFWGRSAAAAVVLLGVGSVLLYMRQAADQQELRGTGGAGSLVRQVELILASGERQVLGQGKVWVPIGEDGRNAQVDTVGKQLIYPCGTEDTTLNYNILRVPRGGEYSLRLSDGTEVWLNAESSLRYPVSFAGMSREVYLSGEAFFKVAKDSRRPFHVHAGGEDIRVLGTSFNVSAYATDLIWHTTLVEGLVSIRERENETRLQPSCQYRMNRETGRSEIEVVDTDLYTSWMVGKIYFKNLSLEHIICRLQRWYDLDIFYQTEDIKQMKFRGTINKYEPMETIFKNLEQITNLHFVVRGNTVTAMKTE